MVCASGLDVSWAIPYGGVFSMSNWVKPPGANHGDAGEMSCHVRATGGCWVVGRAETLCLG